MTEKEEIKAVPPLATWFVTLIILACFSVIGGLLIMFVDNPMSLLVGF